MTNNLGWVLFVIAVLVIISLYANKGSKSSPTTDTNSSTDDVKCELKDLYGRTITITGNSNDPQLQQMCQSQQNQQVYVYGYPYYFVRYWSPFTFWGGGGHRGGHGGHGGGHGK